MQDFISLGLAWVLHLDVHLTELLASHGDWVYLILFGVIFVETGVVFMPFLPGDSLLFVAGALAAKGLLNPWYLLPLMFAAAALGDAFNFAIGTVVRRNAIDTSRIPFVKREHITRTQLFFERHGGKTIVLARFVPIVRTLAPFIAALGAMPARTFFSYNLIGAAAWVVILLLAGHTFGTIPWVGDHLTAVLLGIVVLSVLPGVASWLRARHARSR